MLIDSHCHIPHKKYHKSANEIIVDGKNNGVEKYITIGTSIKDNKIAIETAQKFEEIYCTVGIYPHENSSESVENLVKHLMEMHKNYSEYIVGIGECGIDITNWKGGRSLTDQIELFEMQINVAADLSLPLSIHNRNGSEEILNCLKNTSFDNKGVIHCYTDTWITAKQFLDLGFYISFSGIITYPSAKDLLEVVENVPNDRFLVETDAPYLPPQEFRGETNFPKYVRIVAEKVAQVKQIPIEEVEKFSYENTSRLFQIP